MKTLTLLMMTLSLSSFAAEEVMYEVPAPSPLVPYSRFMIGYETKKNSDGTTEMRYVMPKVLLGQEQEFRFRGLIDEKATSFTLRSASGEMKCEKFPDQTLCNVVHQNVKVDLEAVRATLDGMPISKEEKLGRFELSSLIARREGGDMVGVLAYVPGLGY